MFIELVPTIVDWYFDRLDDVTGLHWFSKIRTRSYQLNWYAI